MHLLDIIIPVARAAEEAAAEPSGPLGTLGIDGTLFIAQLVNFLVVILVLWRFAFKPVGRALAERSERIQKAQDDAARIEREKQAFEQWRTDEASKARLKAAEIVGRAEQEAAKVKEESLAKTKQEQQQLVARAKAQIEEERKAAIGEAKAELADLVISATERVLKEKVDAAKDRQIIERALAATAAPRT